MTTATSNNGKQQQQQQLVDFKSITNDQLKQWSIEHRSITTTQRRHIDIKTSLHTSDLRKHRLNGWLKCNNTETQHALNERETRMQQQSCSSRCSPQLFCRHGYGDPNSLPPAIPKARPAPSSGAKSSLHRRKALPPRDTDASRAASVAGEATTKFQSTALLRSTTN